MKSPQGGKESISLAPDVVVKRDEEKPEPLELIAASVVKVADGLDRMRKSGLTPRAIQVLLHDVTRVPLYQIEQILEAGPKLRKYMLVPETKK